MSPCLYIVMNTKIGSLSNAGKAAAQAAHAANDFQTATEYGLANPELLDAEIDPVALSTAYVQWRQSGTFGTTIILRVPDSLTPQKYRAGVSTLDSAQEDLDKFCLLTGRVTDPSFPVTDGAVRLTARAETCVWGFCAERPAAFDLPLL